MRLTLIMSCIAYVIQGIMYAMKWSIEFQHDFEVEFDAMDAGLQDALLGAAVGVGRIWPGARQAEGRYAEWLNVRKHEGTQI